MVMVMVTVKATVKATAMLRTRCGTLLVGSALALGGANHAAGPGAEHAGGPGELGTLAPAATTPSPRFLLATSCRCAGFSTTPLGFRTTA